MAGIRAESSLRRSFGVKSWSELRRTFDGEPYRCFTAGDGDAAMVSGLRAEGIRCRLISGNVFVHDQDFDRAAAWRPCG